MRYFVFYAVFFMLPGWMITGFARVRGGRWLIALALSHALLVLDLLLLMSFSAPPSWFVKLFAGELVLLVLVWLAKRPWRAVNIRAVRRHSSLVIPCLLLLGGMAVYLISVGPYTEMPADVWEHLARFQKQIKVLESDSFAPASLRDLWFKQGQQWYFLHALICRLAGIDVIGAVIYLTLANSMVWIAGIYWFALKIFSGWRCARSAKIAMAFLAALLAVLHFGVNIFSYLRYYALAPAMLNFICYLAGVVLIIDFIGQSRWQWRVIWPIPFIFIALFVVHTQEALFLFFMALAMSGIETIRIFRAGIIGHVKYPGLGGKMRQPAVIMFGCSASAYALLFCLSRGRPVIASWEIAAIPLRSFIPFAGGMLISHPLGAFFQALTIWGVLVYLLFLMRWRSFPRPAFFYAGMLMPLLTTFNPFTVDIMLRHFRDPMALYRFAYMVPLPWVASGLLYLGLRDIVYGTKPLRRVAGAVAVAGLLLLLLPVASGRLMKANSRVLTLGQVPMENDYHQWRDMIEWVDRQADCSIITDPVTAYTLRGATGQDILKGRFDSGNYRVWLSPGTDDFDPGDLTRNLIDGLAKERHWLLIINERDGGVSRVGEISGHWPADVLKVSQYYHPRILRWINQNPDVFELIWGKDNIRVYAINFDPAPDSASPTVEPIFGS